MQGQAQQRRFWDGLTRWQFALFTGVGAGLGA